MNKRKAVLFLSLWLNVVFVFMLLYSALDGCAEIANGRIGVLTRDVSVALFDDGGSDTESLFMLPKGLVVREASATGAGWFEPYRFRIVVTANDERLVDYRKDSDLLPKKRTEYYSAGPAPKTE